MTSVGSGSLYQALSNIFKRRRKKRDSDDDETETSTEVQVERSGDLPVSQRPVISGVDLHRQQNGKAHHTGRFDMMKVDARDPRLVVRRGQPFLLTVFVDAPSYYTLKFYTFLRFYLVRDGRNEARGGVINGWTSVLVPVHPVDDREIDDKWFAYILSYDEHKLGVSVTTNADCPVGEWQVYIDMAGTSSIRQVKLSKSIFVLFNPWSPEDGVYMENEADRQQYILEDTSQVAITGKFDCPDKDKVEKGVSRLTWGLHQFDEDILQCALYTVTDIRMLPLVYRGSPVHVCRALSGGMNASEEDVGGPGVLVGKWNITNINLEKGQRKPGHWGNSSDILKQFYRTKRSVKFGQCLEYSGITCTACRALGIPARMVTCFGNSVDSNLNMLVDYYSGKVNRHIFPTDSTFNYHMWDEVFMKRPDLGEVGTYDGWQAVDATPFANMAGDNSVQVGPAALKMIKLAQILKPYNVLEFVDRINAVSVQWKAVSPGPVEDTAALELAASLNWKHVGCVILRQKINGEAKFRNVTGEYKYTDGSPEEKEVMFQGLRNFATLDLINDLESTLKGRLLLEKFLRKRAIKISTKIEMPSSIQVGKFFDIDIDVSNNSADEAYDACVMFHLDAVSGRGNNRENLMTRRFRDTVRPSRRVRFTVAVSFESYRRVLAMTYENLGAFIEVSLVDGTESGYKYEQKKYFHLSVPSITIESTEPYKRGVSFPVVAKFTNPLPVPISEGRFTFYGSGFKQEEVTVANRVNQDQVCQAKLSLTPLLAGQRVVHVLFSSPEVANLKGERLIDVSESSAAPPVAGREEKTPVIEI